MSSSDTTASVFSVSIQPASLDSSSGGLITGVIYISLDERAFPDATWSDLIVAVLLGWVESLSGFLDGSDAAELHFMDGPFHVEITPGDQSNWTATLVHDRKRGPTRADYQVRPSAVVNAILNAGVGVLSESAARQWNSRDLVHLGTTMKGLRKRARSLEP